MEVMNSLLGLDLLSFHTPTRLVVICKSPLPRIQILGSARTGNPSEERISDPGAMEELLMLPGFPTKLQYDEASLEQGLFVRLFGAEVFKKHVEGLKSY